MKIKNNMESAKYLAQYYLERMDLTPLLDNFSSLESEFRFKVEGLELTRSSEDYIDFCFYADVMVNADFDGNENLSYLNIDVEFSFDWYKGEMSMSMDNEFRLELNKGLSKIISNCF